MNILAKPPLTENPAWRERGEQRLLLYNVSWDAYLMIGEALRDRPGLRMTYDRGSLEFITTSPEHEILKGRFSDLIKALAEEHDLPLVSAGNMTIQRHDLERGMEPDDCFWIAHEPQMRGRLTWDPQRDPPPDLALEIEISRSALSRMGIYAALGISEVWRFDGETLRVHLLQTGVYHLADASLTFPRIPPAELARFVRPDPQRDSLTEMRLFRQWVRERLAAV